MPPLSEKDRIKAVLTGLYSTYGAPVWRDPLSPVDELISTILSQNTNDTNRDRAFRSLRRRFPDLREVINAPEEEIVDAIRVAGLANQKGPRIKAVLEQMIAETGGLDLNFLAEMPLEEARDWLLRFKGVGRKTAAIVLQFALNRPAFPVDTHIYRVTGRLGVRPPAMNLEKTHLLMEKLIDPVDYFAGHLNLIRLGRENCHPHKPDCPHCPITELCLYPDKTPGG